MTVTAFLAPLAAAFCILLPCAAQGSEPQGKKPYTLPPNPEAVVLVLEYEGGRTPPRKSDEPYFEIRADGSMVVRDVYGLSDKPEIAGKLSPAQLQALLRFVIEEHGLTEWDEDAVERAVTEHVENGGSVPLVADAPTSVVKLALPFHSVTARLYALGIVAPSLPEIAEIQSLLAVERRLRHQASIVVAGGREAAEAMRERANAALAAKFAERKPFALTELTTAHRSRDGTLHATFLRSREQDGKRMQLWATVKTTAEGETEVDVRETASPF